jgi:hypothetical protein
MSTTPNKSTRILPIVGFSVLAAFCGVGVTWLPVSILAILFKHHREQIVAGCMPILIAGGVLGFVADMVVSTRVARSDPKTEQEIERRYVGSNGRLKIYFGAPLFVFAASGALVDLLSRHLSNRVTAYTYFGFFGGRCSGLVLIRPDSREIYYSYWYRRMAANCFAGCGLLLLHDAPADVTEY